MTLGELIILALGLTALISVLISTCVYTVSRCLMERSSISSDLTTLRTFERARAFLASCPKLNTTEGLDMTVRTPVIPGVAVILRRKVGALTRYIVTFRGQQIGSFSSYAAAAVYAEAMGYKVIGVRDDTAS